MAGDVGVKRQHELAGERPELANLAFGERRSHRGYHVAVAVLVGGDYVHIALNHDAGVGVPDGGAREMQAVERVALVKHGRCGSVDVFRIVALSVGGGFAYLPSAKAADIALPVVYGEHQPAAEEVPGSAHIVAVYQAARHRVLGVRAHIGQVGSQAIPLVGGVAELEGGDGVRADAAPAEIAHSRRALRGFERVLVERGGEAVDVVQPAAPVAFLLVRGGKIHARLLREDAERL